MQKTYYKAITKDTRCSIIATDKNVSVTYPVKQWVKPLVKGSKLFVCKTKKDAIWHSQFLGDSVTIVKCYIKNPKDAGYRLFVDQIDDASIIESFWKDNASEVYYEWQDIKKYSVSLLSKTILCDEVYCLE